MVTVKGVDAARRFRALNSLSIHVTLAKIVQGRNQGKQK